MTQQEVFDADRDRFHRAFTEAGAIVVGFDGVGHFTYIDQAKVSATLVRAYGGLMEYGFANGLVR